MQEKSNVLYEGSHRLVKEVIDFGEYESRTSFVNGIAKQRMIGRILDEVEQSTVSQISAAVLPAGTEQLPLVAVFC